LFARYYITVILHNLSNAVILSYSDKYISANILL
jgi:hypothetical protein